MSNRQLRRAAERKARKEAHKTGVNAANLAITQSTVLTPDQAPLLQHPEEEPKGLLREHLDRIDAQDLSESERTAQYEHAFNLARKRVNESIRHDREKAAAFRAAAAPADPFSSTLGRFTQTERLTSDVEFKKVEVTPSDAAPELPEIEPAPEPTSENSRAGVGGPCTPEGRAKASLNSLKHGLTGSFRIVGNEHQHEFDSVVAAYTEEHQPATPTELSLIEKMAEHQWLSRRAQRLQDYALTQDELPRLNLYIRYQTTNERAFYKAFSEFKKLKKERLATENQPDQFVSQKAAEAKAEWQAARVRLANARAGHLEVDAKIRQALDIPTQNGFALPFQEVKELFTRCLTEKCKEMMAPKAA